MSPERRITQSERMSIPSLSQILGAIDQHTLNNDLQHELFKNNIGALIDYYHAVYSAATGKGYRKLNRFNKELTQGDNSIYNPDQVKYLESEMKFIRSKVYGPVSRRKR